MTTVSVSRPVSAAPQVVWELISDVTRMGEWSPETTGARWTGGATGPATGAKFRGSNANGWRRWSTSCTVTDCEPGATFAFRVTAGPLAVATWRYDIEATREGCRVTETWIDERGTLAKLGGGPMSGVGDREAHNRAGMEETLRRLAAAAEAQPPS